MVKLRLRRVGKKKHPIYKIVVTDSKASRDGKYIESLGQYNPLVEPIAIIVNEMRLFWWLKRGAQPTDTLRSLLRRNGLWLKWSLVKKGSDDETITGKLEKWQMLQDDKLRREAEIKARRKADKKKKSVVEASPVSATPTPAAEPVVAPTT